MKLVACDGTWTQSSGALSCVGTLVTVDQSELSQSGITPEESSDLTGQAIILFAIVFGFLALRKAL
ncbi:hypothetical protein D3C76_250580 [compost metagenome]